MLSPKRFTSFCKNTKPHETIDCWIAIGAPIFKTRPAAVRSSRSSRAEKRRSSYRLRMYQKPTTQETICEITVAIAAPATPMWNAATNRRSSATLSTDETSRK